MNPAQSVCVYHQSHMNKWVCCMIKTNTPPWFKRSHLGQQASLRMTRDRLIQHFWDSWHSERMKTTRWGKFPFPAFTSVRGFSTVMLRWGSHNIIVLQVCNLKLLQKPAPTAPSLFRFCHQKSYPTLRGQGFLSLEGSWQLSKQHRKSFIISQRSEHYINLSVSSPPDQHGLCLPPYIPRQISALHGFNSLCMVPLIISPRSFWNISTAITRIPRVLVSSKKNEYASVTHPDTSWPLDGALASNVGACKRAFHNWKCCDCRICCVETSLLN